VVVKAELALADGHGAWLADVVQQGGKGQGKRRRFQMVEHQQGVIP
jgi:hypothetical protein